jgi:hypothetical protein
MTGKTRLGAYHNFVLKNHSVIVHWKNALSKSTETCAQVWTTTREMCQDLAYTLEKNVHVSAGYTLVGCRFHVGHSWFITVQQKEILLTQYNEEKSEVSTSMDHFFASSLSLPDGELNGFTELMYQMIHLLT